MSPSDIAQSQLITKIYDAAINPDLWQPVLQQIQSLCGTDQCTLFFYDAFCRTRNYASAARINANGMEVYLDHLIDAQAADINNRLKDLPVGKVVSNEDIRRLADKNYEELVGNEYMEKAWPNLQFQAGIVLLRSERVCAGFGLQSFKNSPPITGNRLAFLQELATHLVNAINIHQTLSHAQQQQNAFSHIISNIHQGVLLLDAHLHILSSNNEAIRIIEQNSIFIINHRGQICPHPSLDKGSLASFFDELITGKLQEPIYSFALSDSNSAPIKLRVIPLNCTVLFLFNNPNSECFVPQQYMTETYSLTETECELLYFLLNGHTLNDSAVKCYISAETARWRLKKILKKTNTHSQAELSRLVLSLCD